MKHRFILLLCIIGFVTTAAVSAQSPSDAIGFSFWLLTDKGLWKYDHNGNLLDSMLKAHPDDQPYDTGAHVSADGRLIGFRDGQVWRKIGGSASSQEWFNWKVVDTETDTLLYEDQPAFNIDHVDAAFSADHSTIVYAGFDTRGVDWDWQIIVADLTNGSKITTLDSNMLETTVLSADHYENHIDILNLDGSRITFTIGTYRQFETYTWDYVTHAITQLDSPIPLTRIRVDRSHYDETIYPEIDERFPFNGNYWQSTGITFNTLYATTPYQDEPFPFYASSEHTLAHVRFVQNDERIMLNCEMGYILLDRDGAVVATDMPYSDWITPTPDGYMFVERNAHSSTPKGIYRVNTRGDTPVASYILGLEDLNGKYNEIVWVESPPSTTVQELQPLVPPELDQIALHHVVYIRTTEGDTLNVREQPSTSATVVYHAANNERALLVNGPVEAEGFVWWQLQFNEDLVGWAVESIPGELDTLHLPANGQTRPVMLVEANADADLGLAVGKIARVINDAVNVRVAAGTDKQVEEVLARGAVVTLISGPENVEGLRWWRVETPTGNQGWVIETTREGIVILQAME